MESSQKYSEREKLELIYNLEYKQVQQSKLSSVLKIFWQQLLNFFSRYNEPRIREHSDHFGNTWWTVYDPLTGRSASFGSTQEVLAWIEQRYPINSRF